MTEQEMRHIIDKVADRFEEASNTRVLASAREALLTPAIPHMDTVTRDLQMGKISERSLEEAVQQVLENALADIQKRNLESIDDIAMQRSMDWYCPYLFWC